jgi:predicted O-methyltransferase YrrM
MATQWTLERFLETARSHRLPFILLVLVRTGVLAQMARGTSRVEDLARECGVDAGALARLLDALVSIGLVRAGGNGYALVSSLAEDLAPDAVGGPLDGLRHTADGLDKWMRLEDALRAGRAQYPDELDVTRDPERNERFIRAMHSHARPAARRFADLLEREDARTFLDTGGGPGTFCLALLDRWPDMRAAVADLPLTLRVTRRVLEEAGMADRVRLIETDFYAQPASRLEGPWDLVLISAVIHAEGERENRALLSRLRSVVSPGGRIVVRENILDPDRRGPPRAALFDVHMLVSTRRGRCYTREEIERMLLDAGFEDPRRLGEPEDGFVAAYAPAASQRDSTSSSSS